MLFDCFDYYRLLDFFFKSGWSGYNYHRMQNWDNKERIIGEYI